MPPEFGAVVFWAAWGLGGGATFWLRGAFLSVVAWVTLGALAAERLL